MVTCSSGTTLAVTGAVVRAWLLADCLLPARVVVRNEPAAGYRGGTATVARQHATRVLCRNHTRNREAVLAMRTVPCCEQDPFVDIGSNTKIHVQPIPFCHSVDISGELLDAVAVAKTDRQELTDFVELAHYRLKRKSWREFNRNTFHVVID